MRGRGGEGKGGSEVKWVRGWCFGLLMIGESRIGDGEWKGVGRGEIFCI